MCICIYGYYFTIGGSFIWESDGFSQHFLLFNEYIEILQNLLKGGSFPQWDWSIGAGADTITSYGYYVIGDPFVYLGVFFPENLRELSFHLLIFLRIWCVGISYIFFTRKFKISHQAGLLGAVMYTFSFFVIYNVKRHPFFIMPLILYPILCLGVEKILKKESGIIFSIVVAISSMVNFYFFYKLTILTFIYGSVRYLTLYGFKNIKHLFLTLCQCIIYYLIGLFIGSILFLPMVGGFLDASRHTGEITLNLIHYHISYYIVLIHNAFVPYSYLWSVGGLSIFSLFTIIFFMRTKKEKNFAAIISLLLGVFLLIPFFGSFMNGMSGPYNRFSFVIPFFIAIGSGQLLDARKKIRKKDLKIAKYLLIIFTLIYLIAAILENMYTFYLTPIIIGWAMWLLFLYEIKFSLFSNKISTIFIVLVMINMATNAMNLYYSYGNNSISDTVELNTSISKYKDLYGGLQKDLPKDEWYRVGVTSQDKEIRNQFIYHDLKGLSTYLSITNKYISNFAKEMDFSTYQIIQPLRNGLDDRRLMNYFLNVKYILTKKENENYLPVGYSVIKESTSNSNYILAKTEYSFPFAYTVDKIMFREHFSKLNPLEKEYILTQGAVLEDSISIPTKSFEKGLNSHFNRVEYSIKDNDLDTKKNKWSQFDIKEKETKINVKIKDIKSIKNHEIFIELKGLKYEELNKPFYFPENTKYDMKLLYGDSERAFRQSDKYSFSTYFNRESVFINLGSVKENIEDIVIQFEDEGRYTIGDIVIYARPINMKIDEEIISEKQKNQLNISHFENEYIKGQIYQDESSFLVTTIPYTKGWQATVNGAERKILQTNIGFIGIPLESGNSEVIFTYQNPYIKTGMYLSILGIVLLLMSQVLFIIQKDN